MRLNQKHSARVVGVGIALASTLACGGESKTGDTSTTTAPAAGGVAAGGASGTSTTTAATGAGGSIATSSGSSTTSGGSTMTTASSSTSTATGGAGATLTSGTGGGATATSGSGAGGTSAGGVCPTSPPGDGTDCQEPWVGFPSAHCAYGDDPRPECRTRALCSNGAWVVSEPEASVCGEPPLPDECPSAVSIGSACTTANLNCWYADGTRCTCSPCQGGSAWPVCGTIDPPQWACVTPDASCPNPLPNAGDACTEEQQQCGLDCELPISCQDGVWHWEQNACPICAAPDTPIATPNGEQPIASLRVGDVVYSVDDQAIVAVPLIKVGSTRVSRHRVVRVELSNGSVLEISPGHPTADGKTFGELVPGAALGEARVAGLADVAYRYDRTYDILPASKSGAYFAAGALIGSTLTGH